MEHLLWRTDQDEGPQAPQSYRRFRLGEPHLDELIVPADPHLVRTTLARWIADAHEEMARVADHRGRPAPRAEGTDRWEYLVNEGTTALHAIPGVKTARPNGSFLVWLDDVAIYQFRFASTDKVSPLTAVLSGTLIRELVGSGFVTEPLFHLEEPTPPPPPFQELVLLPWAGNRRDGLASAFIGQGTTNDAGQIQWNWLEPLLPEGSTPPYTARLQPLPLAFPADSEPALQLGLRQA